MKRFENLAIVCVFTVAALVLPAFGQPSSESSDPQPTVKPLLELGSQLQLGGPLSGVSRQRVLLSAELKTVQNGRNGLLSVKAEIIPHWHIYSITQPTGGIGPIPTKLTIEPSDEFEVTGPFQADRAPETRKVEFWTVPAEEHEGTVVWTAPIRLAEGVQPQTLNIKVVYEGQVCADVEYGGQCVNVGPLTVTAKYVESADTYRANNSHATIRGYVEPRVAVPGQRTKLVLTVTPDVPYHVYALAYRDPEFGNKPTLIAVTQPAAWEAYRPVASTNPVPDDKSSGALYHEGEVSWSIDLQVPLSAEEGEHTITGVIGYQTCTDQGCDPMTAAQFEVTLAVGTEVEPGQLPLTFASYASYAKAAVEAESMQWATMAAKSLDERPVVVILGLAFVAGLILNVMPCVLPVIGLKVMSFVEQAGESRWRVVMLNVWYSAGLLAVFMVLATLAFVFQVAWGAWLSSAGFSIALAAIVFVFGLSLLGVWEIPIPGFVGSGSAGELAQKEGAFGAFCKGVLTTVLATPCTGPFLGPAIGWAIKQPAWLNYTTFACVGLGMASPYLVLGFYPKLVNLLPRPGAWMETFKQLMGFVLMGTVVFIFYFLDTQYTVPTLSLLVALALACWWIGRMPLTAPMFQKARAWSGGIAVALIVALVAFVQSKYLTASLSVVTSVVISAWWIGGAFMATQPGRRILALVGSCLVVLAGCLVAYISLLSVELPWQPFTRAELDQLRSKGHTILVDFTADW